LLRSGFSLDRARELFVSDLEQGVADSDYLAAGAWVEGWLQSLGRQRWPVLADAAPRSYGIDTSGACEPGSRSRPLSAS
jgi:hypothetical protein